MIHAWHAADRNLPVPQRMGFTLAEAGPSITITSLTNALSFGIGALSTTPAIQIFCTYTAVAVAVDYFFQVTFFSAVLVIGGRREKLCRNAYFPCLKVEKDSTSTLPKLDGKLASAMKKLHQNVLDVAVDFFVSLPAKIFVTVFLVVFWATAIYGCTKMRVELSPDKLFLEDSPLHFVIYVQNTFLFKESGQLSIFVSNPGNLNDRGRLHRLMSLVDEFENIPGYSMGTESTAIWLRQYMPFVGFQKVSRGFDPTEIAFDYKYLPEFLAEDQYYRWNHYVNLNAEECLENEPGCVRSFMLTTGRDIRRM